MGFLLKPHDFHSFHSSDIINRHQIISNRLFLIALFAVALTTLPIYEATAAVVELSDQQDASDVHSTCESKTLDDVPPNPVSWKKLLRYIIEIDTSEERKQLNSEINSIFISNFSSSMTLPMSLSLLPGNWASSLPKIQNQRLTPFESKPTCWQKRR